MKKESSWEAATWDGLEAVQRREMAKMPFREKLLWLEQASEFAKKLSSRNSPSRLKKRKKTKK